MASTPWQPGGCLQSLLGILETDEVPGVHDNTLTVEGVSQAELDVAIAQYHAAPELYQLGPVRKSRSKAIVGKAARFVAARYSTDLQTMYVALMVDALIHGQANRMAYIGQLLAWVKQVSQLSIEAEAAIAAAATVEQIRAVQLDLTDIEASDPHTTIKAALLIED